MRAKRLSIITLLITIFLLVITYTVVFADDTDEKTLTIENQSRRDVQVTLFVTETTTISYTFWVEAGDTDHYKVEEGEYTISYVECWTEDDYDKDKIDFPINMVDKNYSLTIYDCQYQPTRLWVSNHLSEKPTLELYGYDDYEFDVDKGRNSFKVYSGSYVYSYEACDGETYSGEVYVTKNGLTDLILHSCEWFLQPAQVYGGPNPVGFKIVNHASYPVILTLIGPANYLVTADFGINRYELVRGTYKYSYYQNLIQKTGTFVVTPNGQGTLVITPSYTIDFVADEDLE